MESGVYIAVGVLVICGNAESNLRNEICGSRLRNGG